MTNAFPDNVDPAAGRACHLRELLAAYASGSMDDVVAWSVEAHLSACRGCRVALSAHVDPGRLARNRSLVLVRTGTGEHGAARRLLARMGVPDHMVALLAATPSLRRSWLLSVVAVLAIVSGESVLAQHLSAHPLGVNGASWGVLTPFILVGPLTVLAGVATAFLPAFDPSYQLAVAAPFSGLSLLLVRCLAALVAALVLVVAAAFVVPAPGWLPAALLLPCLALCCLALAAVTVVGPVAAAVLAGALWVLPVMAVTVRHSVIAAVQWHAQLSWGAALLVAATVLVLRRDRLEPGWTP
jgi:hypothetical protein